MRRGLSTAQKLTLLMGGVAQYYQRVLALSPIAYWPLWEASGAVANDISGNAYHGAYSNVTLGQTGIGDGRTCAQFVRASSSYVNLYTAGLRTNFPTAEGTLAAWIKVAAAEWAATDTGYVVCFQVDTSNRFYLSKYRNSGIYFQAILGGAPANWLMNPSAPVGWIHIAVSWSTSADEKKSYYNGALVQTQTGLGTWAGSLDIARMVLGANITTPANIFEGHMAHVVLFDRALDAAQLL